MQGNGAGIYIACVVAFRSSRSEFTPREKRTSYL